MKDYSKSEGASPRIGFRIPEKMKEELEEEAEASGVSKSEIIRAGIRKEIR